MVSPLGGLDIVAKYPMVKGRKPELTRLALVAVVRWFLLQNRRHPNILCKFSDYNYVILMHGSDVNDVDTGKILVASLWTRWRVSIESGSTEFLCRVSSLGSVIGSSFWRRKWRFNICIDRDRRLREYGILIWWNNMWRWKFISRSNHKCTDGRCVHITRKC